MPVSVGGKMVDGRTIVLDRPLAEGQKEVLVHLKKSTRRARLKVPEQFVLRIAETDIEEIS